MQKLPVLSEVLTQHASLGAQLVTSSLMSSQGVKRSLTCATVVARALDDGCDAISGSDGVIGVTGAHSALDRAVSIVPLAVCGHLEHVLTLSCTQWPRQLLYIIL